MILDRHAYWRADVGLGELEWSEEMSESADGWARELVEGGCSLRHRPNNKFGENLFYGTAGYYTAGDAVDAWGEEKDDYTYSSNKCKSEKMCEHYTHIVWKTTTKVGCAREM